MNTNTLFKILFFLSLIIFSCKKSDLPDTTGDVPPPPTMEISDPDILLKNAEFYINEGRHEVALQALNAALKYGADKGKVRFLKGRLFLNKKEYDKALQEFNNAEKAGYFADEINLYKGTLYFNKDKLNKALEFYKNAEKKMIATTGGLKRMGNVLYQNLGLLYQKRKNYKKAVFYFNKSISLDPSSSETFFHAGLSYYKLDNYDKSIEYLEKTIKLKPRMFKAYKYLATVYYTKGKKNESFYVMAKGYVVKQTYENTQYAHKELSKIKNIVNYKEALELMIYSKISIGLFKAAEALINKALKKYPSDSIFLVFAGRLELKKNNAKKALLYAEKAMKKYGSNFEIEILKGNIYTRLNNDDKAIEHLEKALYINPQNYTYRYTLADTYRRKKKKNLEYLHQGIYFAVREQYDQAKFALSKLPEDFKRSYEANCWLGRVFMEQGVNQTALEYLNKSIKQKPDYFLPYTFKLFVLFKMGRKQQGLATLKYFMEKYPEAKGISEIKKLYKSFSKF